MGKKNTNKFYAVARGTEPGVYLSWEECSKQVAGFKGCLHKSFPTLIDAQQYVSLNRYEEARAPVDQPAESNSLKRKAPDDVSAAQEDATLVEASRKLPKVEDVPCSEEEGFTVIYTDGSSRNNGFCGAIAGSGVFFGTDDPRNIAERLPGDRQTNQRAELFAIIRALESVTDTEPVIIKTDSQYSINCYTIWHQNWARNGWLNSSNREVENRDLVQRGLDLLCKRTGKTKLFKVKAHIGIMGNEMADRLANEGAQKPAVESEVKSGHIPDIGFEDEGDFESENESNTESSIESDYEQH